MHHCLRMTRFSTLGMSTSKVTNVRWCFFVAILLLDADSVQGPSEPLKIVYTATPKNITSRTNAIFSFNVVGSNGTNSCAVEPCSFTCKLDQLSLQDCSTWGASFSNLKDGGHIFSVSVTTSSGAFVASEFRWKIDTVAPTAVVDGGVHNGRLISGGLCMSDRTIPSLSLWTAVPSCEVIIGNQLRTCEVTNRASDLRIYVDFDTPVNKDMLRLLSVNNGVLTPTGRNSLGNRRFGFRLSNITNGVSEVTIALAGNAVSNRYGTIVPGNSSTTFLYALRRLIRVRTL